MRILMISAEGPPLARATALVDVLEETRQLEGAVKNREDALAWVKSEYLEDGGKRPTSNVQHPTSN
jgi:hypothetical protein